MQPVSPDWTTLDYVGAIRARLGFFRDQYSVEPGLYAVGNPTPASPVMVSANYKLSFDLLRNELHGLDAYILVLDTKGVNVWCAAGKGTFGTAEVVRMVLQTGLAKIVSHKNLILPQLSATGVMAHVVKSLCGFKVNYGPVRAKDIPAYLKAGMKATLEMRRMDFVLMDRLAVSWAQLVQTIEYPLVMLTAMLLLSHLTPRIICLRCGIHDWLAVIVPLVLAWTGGSFLVPAFLPYLPGRSFSIKGAVMGALMSILYIAPQWKGDIQAGQKMEWAAIFLIVMSLASFIALNFTGSSTYTSLSGVKKEMKYAIPSQITVAVLGLALWTFSRFISV
jgi:hypothetical protein